MRNGYLTSALLLLALGTTSNNVAFADDPANGAVVNVNASYVFAPVGFDDNDEVELVIDGYLPSGCYRVTQPEVSVDHEAQTILIKPMARYFDVPCIEALVPYFAEIKVGQLTNGNYAITVAGPDRTLTDALPVVLASGPGPDNFTYAPVDEVRVETDATGHLVAILQGRFTSRCMEWGEVRAEDQGKTILILPILTIAADTPCQASEIPYTKLVPLPSTVTRGRHLLHVRTLNGQAVNKLFFAL